MRIGQSTEIYRPHINGVANFVALHKHTLESWGHEVFVFTLGYENYADAELHVMRSPAIPISDTGYHIGLGFSRHIRDEIKTMDVLHVHHPFLIGQHTVNLAKQHDIPVIFTNHSRYHLLATHYVPLATEELSRAFMSTYLSNFASQCDLVIAPSPGIKKVLQEMGVNGHIEVIPNGIDLERFRHPAAPLTKQAQGFPDDALVAITVGRLAPEKNLPLLLQAFDRISDQVPALHLIVVGQGPQQENLKELVQSLKSSSHIRMVGQIPYEKISDWLAMADFFAIPSISESHPLVVLEALAAGLPVVGIPSPGIEDTIVDGLNGLHSSENADVFGMQLWRLASEPELRARLADGARKTSSQYDIRRTSSTLVTHYERLIEERARHRMAVHSE